MEDASNNTTPIVPNPPAPPTDETKDSSNNPVLDFSSDIEANSFNEPSGSTYEEDSTELNDSLEPAASPQPTSAPVLQMPVNEEPAPVSIEFPKSITQNVEKMLQEEIEREKATLHKEEAEVAEKENHIAEEMRQLEQQQQAIKEEQATVAEEKDDIAKGWEQERIHEEQAQKAIQDLEASTHNE